jgi:peptidyl-prolyl cis-trans isomerase D
MLDLIRKKQRSVLIKVVFWVIIAAFVGTIFLVWGKGSGGPDGRGEVAVRVNGDKIGYQEYQTAYENLRQMYKDRFGKNFTPAMEKRLQLHRQTCDQLINRLLLLQEAQQLDVEVSKKELVAAIAEMPMFQENGVFSRDRYQRVLDYQRLTARDFEQDVQSRMLIEQVVERIEQEATVTDEEVDQEYRNRREKVNLAFVRLAPSRFESRVKVDEEDLREYYEEHREDFRVPEKVALRFVKFDPERYAQDVEMTDEALEKFYQRHQDLFFEPEQVKASHILFRVTAGNDEKGRAKKRALAEKVLDQARSGKDFAQLARRHSDDAASAVKGGELGYFTRGTMVPDFENVAFSLQPGQISDLVETSFGFHIIKCEGRIEAGVKPLGDVMDEVRAGYRKEQARQLALDKAMEAYSVHRQSGDIDAVAGNSGLSVEDTKLFARGEAVEGIGDVPEIALAAFSLQEGQLARPVVLSEGIYLFALKQRQASFVPDLKEVHAAVERAFRQQQSVGLARQAAEQLLKELQAGKKLADLARKQKEQVAETGFFPRSYGSFIPRLGDAPQLAKVAFTLTAEAPVADQVFAIDNRFVVASLRQRQEADMSALSASLREDLRKEVLARKRDTLLQERLDSLRTQADIRIDAALTNTLEGEQIP